MKEESVYLELPFLLNVLSPFLCLFGFLNWMMCYSYLSLCTFPSKALLDFLYFYLGFIYFLLYCFFGILQATYICGFAIWFGAFVYIVILDVRKNLCTVPTKLVVMMTILPFTSGYSMLFHFHFLIRQVSCKW